MPTLNDARRLYAVLHPKGLWSEPCVVQCECGYYGLAVTCVLAQSMAWAHDAEHWAGKIGVLAQGSLFDDLVEDVDPEDEE